MTPEQHRMCEQLAAQQLTRTGLPRKRLRSLSQTVKQGLATPREIILFKLQNFPADIQASLLENQLKHMTDDELSALLDRFIDFNIWYSTWCHQDNKQADHILIRAHGWKLFVKNQCK